MTYNSKSAQLLRHITSTSKVVWTPETGWVNEKGEPAKVRDLSQEDKIKWRNAMYKLGRF